MNSANWDAASNPSPGRDRLTTFVPGVGEVPSGPRRTSFSPFRITPRRIKAAYTSSNTLVRIKQEDTERDWSSDSAVGDSETLQGAEVKREVSHGVAESLNFDSDYQTVFANLLATSDRHSRSDTAGSRRQDASEGRSSRSNIPTGPRAQNRSRSPRRPGSSRYTPSYGGRGSSMFYPDSRERMSLYPDTHIPYYSILRRRASDSATEDPGRTPAPQTAPVSSEPSQPPSLTASVSPPSTSSSASARLMSSSTEPPVPSEVAEEELPGCQCPIGPLCTVRSGNHLDCRPLVREYTALKERRDQDAFEM